MTPIRLFARLVWLFSAANLDLVSETVEIRVGEHVWQLPPGSFWGNQVGTLYRYGGGPDSPLRSVIVNLNNGRFRIVGSNLDLSGMGDTAEISISAGTFSGSTMVGLTAAGPSLRY